MLFGILRILLFKLLIDVLTFKYNTEKLIKKFVSTFNIYMKYSFCQVHLYELV